MKSLFTWKVCLPMELTVQISLTVHHEWKTTYEYSNGSSKIGRSLTTNHSCLKSNDADYVKQLLELQNRLEVLFKKLQSMKRLKKLIIYTAQKRKATQMART